MVEQEESLNSKREDDNERSFSEHEVNLELQFETDDALKGEEDVPEDGSDPLIEQDQVEFGDFTRHKGDKVEDLLSEDTQQGTSAGYHVCKLCSRSFHYENSCRKHEQSCGTDRNACEYCNKKLRSKVLRRKHTIFCGPYKCHPC